MENFESLFYKGEVLSSYQCAINSSSPLALRYIEMYEKQSVHLIPIEIIGKEVQSVEMANEQYAEDEWVESIRAIRQEEAFQLALKELESQIAKGDMADKAHALYTQGRLFLYSHLYDEAIYSLVQAAKTYPEKGLYAGITGQTMLRLNYSPIEALGYIELAKKADAQNARWSYCQALLLIQLYKDLYVMEFLDNAIYEMQVAKSLCRDDQKSFMLAIEQLDREIAEILRNL